MRAAVLALLLAIGAGCGYTPITGHNHGPWGKVLVVVVTNNDVAYPETFTCTWWIDSTIVGSSTICAPPGGKAIFPCYAPRQPDGLSIQAAAWGGSGNVFGAPDYDGADQFQVPYPVGTPFKQPPY